MGQQTNLFCIEFGQGLIDGFGRSQNRVRRLCDITDQTRLRISTYHVAGSGAAKGKYVREMCHNPQDMQANASGNLANAGLGQRRSTQTAQCRSLCRPEPEA